MEEVRLGADEQIVQLNSVEQLVELLGEQGSVKIVIGKLTEVQELRLKDLIRTPLWKRMPKEEFDEYLKSTMKTGRKIFGHHEDKFIKDVCKVMDIPEDDHDIQILRENYYLRTSSYEGLSAGLKQIARLVISIIPKIIPDPSENLDGAK
jgi:hypothetical protein